MYRTFGFRFREERECDENRRRSTKRRKREATLDDVVIATPPFQLTRSFGSFIPRREIYG